MGRGAARAAGTASAGIEAPSHETQARTDDCTGRFRADHRAGCRHGRRRLRSRAGRRPGDRTAPGRRRACRPPRRRGSRPARTESTTTATASSIWKTRTAAPRPTPARRPKRPRRNPAKRPPRRPGPKAAKKARRPQAGASKPGRRWKRRPLPRPGRRGRAQSEPGRIERPSRRRGEGAERDRRRAAARRRRRLAVQRRRRPHRRKPLGDDRPLRPDSDRRPQLRHRLVRDPALPAADLPGVRHPVRDSLGGARLDQQDRDRLRHQPQRLQRRRGRLDAVPALDLGDLRRRRQRRRPQGPLQPGRRDLRGRQLPEGGGGAKHLYSAILSYNHADWYARRFCSTPAPTASCRPTWSAR